MGRSAWDIVGVFDALYTAPPDGSWADGVAAAARRYLKGDEGVGGVLYDASSEQTISAASVRGMGLPDEWLRYGQLMHRADPATVIRGYRSLRVVTATQLAKESRMPERAAREFFQTMKSCGIGDQCLINGYAGHDRGYALYLFTRKPSALRPKEKQALQTLARHIGAVYRLRLRRDISPDAADAVLTPSGRVEARRRGEWRRPSSPSLDDAIELRSRLLHRSGNDSLTRIAALDKAMGPWQLFDWTDRDGKKYALAYASVDGVLGQLFSQRELQVLTLATVGRTNKEIGYELDLAHSTVRVMLARAAQKLQVHTRSALVDVVRTLLAEDRVDEPT